VGLVLLVRMARFTPDRPQSRRADDWFSDPPYRRAHVHLRDLSAAVHLVASATSQRQPYISLKLYGTRNFVLGSIYVVVLGMMLFARCTYYAVSPWRSTLTRLGGRENLNGERHLFTIGLVAGALLMSHWAFAPAWESGPRPSWPMCVLACRLTPQISDDAMYLPLALTGFGAVADRPRSRLIIVTRRTCSPEKEWNYTCASANSAGAGASRS